MWRTVGFTLGGLVAGEGSFHVVRRQEQFARDGSPRLRFVFQVAIAERDGHLLLALQRYLGCGALRASRPLNPNHQTMQVFTISSVTQHRRVTIPFAHAFLMPCAKRDQFERWVERMDAYERDRPTQYGRGPSSCSVEGCSSPVRGRGLCRRHYYRATGY
jgi:hypothetical protein